MAKTLPRKPMPEFSRDQAGGPARWQHIRPGPAGHIKAGAAVSNTAVPAWCASGQWTFSALVSSKNEVFPPAISVATNLTVMVLPTYAPRLVVYSTYLLPLFAAVATGTVWTTVPEEFRISSTRLFSACLVLLVTFEFTSTQ